MDSKTIIILGCSNANNMHISPFATFFPNANIVNLSEPGTGNYYAYCQLYEYLLLNSKPDYVYMQFSGLHRMDIKLDNKWQHSGGLNGSGLRGLYARHFVTLYTDNNLVNIRATSIQHCMNTILLCEHLGIPYNYTWYYNLFKCEDPRVEMEGFVEKLPKFFPTRHFLSSYPHSFALEHNDLEPDGVHYGGYTQERWFNKQLNKLQIDTPIKLNDNV